MPALVLVVVAGIVVDVVGGDGVVGGVVVGGVVTTMTMVAKAVVVTMVKTDPRLHYGDRAHLTDRAPDHLTDRAPDPLTDRVQTVIFVTSDHLLD